MADFVAICLRGLAYAAALLASGTAIFGLLFSSDLDRSARAIRLMAVSTAGIGLMLTVAHAIVEPVRLTGELRGMFDGSLHAMLLQSDFGTATATRVFGLALIVAGALRSSRLGEGTALIGASVAVASFTFMGHTASDGQRWLLAPLLIMHLIAVAFWFGGLGPLLSAARRERAAVSGAIVEQFSKVAIWLVPIILVAGIAIAGVLLRNLSSLSTPYGFLLIAKVTGFAILMLLAAVNKWRLGPRIAIGDDLALMAFQRIVRVEWILILAIVMVTAVMTALFSPP